MFVSFKSCYCPDEGEPAAGVVSFPRTIEVGESPALPQDRARHLHKSWWDVLRKVLTHSGASVVVISGHWHHPFARVVAAKGSQRGIKIGIELLSTSELFSSIIEENSSDVDSIVWIWHFSVKVGNKWRKMERKELSLEIPPGTWKLLTKDRKGRMAKKKKGISGGKFWKYPPVGDWRRRPGQDWERTAHWLHRHRLPVRQRPRCHFRPKTKEV